MAFLLPDELVATIAKCVTKQALMSINSLDPKSLAHLLTGQARYVQTLLACGLWDDGGSLQLGPD